jgi:hypothetical protein
MSRRVGSRSIARRSSARVSSAVSGRRSTASGSGRSPAVLAAPGQLAIGADLVGDRSRTLV